MIAMKGEVVGGQGGGAGGGAKDEGDGAGGAMAMLAMAGEEYANAGLINCRGAATAGIGIGIGGAGGTAGGGAAAGGGEDMGNVFDYNNRVPDLVAMDPPTPSLLSVARKVNSFYLTGLASSCIPLIVDNFRVGLLTPNVMDVLRKDEVEGRAGPFVIRDTFVEFGPDVGPSHDERSKAIATLLLDWKARDLFIALQGWRDECFDVSCHFDNPSLLKMERSATFLFGIRKYGVDINGYVRHPVHGICIWLQKRASKKQTWPGYWDNMVGGGLSCGYTVNDTAWKEAKEEASITNALLKSNLKAIGTVSYFFHNERGLSPNTEFVFDLELPLNFRPVNSDGEVDEFNLVTAEEALRVACGSAFKTTSCPVIIDFMIRHGLITEQSEPQLMEIKKLFNVPLETFYYRD